MDQHIAVITRIQLLQFLLVLSYAVTLFALPVVNALAPVLTITTAGNILHLPSHYDDPVRPINACNGNLVIDLTNDCPICFNNLDNNLSINVTNCGHAFHSNCLASWTARNPSCPFAAPALTLCVIPQTLLAAKF